MNKEFNVEGMHCEKCAGRVKTAINNVDPQAAVQINLKKKQVQISSEDMKNDDIYLNAIRDAGYQVI